jgi:carbonic anhydrase
MCQKCDASPADHASGVPRRNFLKLAAAAAAGLALPRYTVAAEKAVPPKSSNVLSPDAAFDRLMKGNTRYVNGVMKSHDFIAERPALVMGQNPFAGILSCADSRIAPEYAFDTGRGDLFVCRVAGNFANKDSIASFEYGVAVLGVPLILVLGHEACGAVDSTIKAVKEGTTFPGHIPSLLNALTPAVKSSMNQPGSLLDNSIRKNVLLNVERLKSAGPILSKAVERNKLRVAGGIYHLETGRVEIVA